MSLETWKREFYPIDAKSVPVADAVAHSLKKWEGLLPENLARHGVTFLPDFHRLMGGPEELSHFPIGADSCALCAHHWNRDDDGCVSCPLCIVRDFVPCDRQRWDEGGDGDCYHSPWSQFANADEPDPKPMIMWLQRTLDSQSDK